MNHNINSKRYEESVFGTLNNKTDRPLDILMKGANIQMNNIRAEKRNIKDLLN